MNIPNDPVVLLRDLGAYAYDPTTDPEIAAQLQNHQGSAADKVIDCMEILYAFRDRLSQRGLRTLGELSGFALAQRWYTPAEPDRISKIYAGVSHDVDGTELEVNYLAPAPQTSYRADQIDWRANVPQPTIDALKAAKSNAVNQMLEAQFLRGFTPADGPLAGKTLQVRDLEDRTNWLTSQASYLAAVSGGQGAVMGADFRTADNSTVNCSYQDGLNTLLAMAAWGKSLMGNSWGLKDAIAAVTVVDGDVGAAYAALQAIDINSGWPA